MSKSNRGNRKPSNNRPTRKPDPKRRGRDEVREGDESDPKYMGYRNDASDYIPDPVLRNQVGNFSFNTTIGLPDLYMTEIAGAASAVGSSQIGAVMEIQVFTNIGLDSDTLGTNLPTLGINAAALKMYNKNSADNGKTTKYLPEDIAMAIVMIGEFVGAVSNYQRAYGTAFNSNYRNRTVPKLLIKAMGFDPDDFFLHLSEGRLRMNRLLSIASNIQIPFDIKWFKRTWEMYAHVFYDKGSAMGQYYVTRPAGFFKYYEQYDVTQTDPRQLVEGRFFPLVDVVSVSSYLDMVEDMLNRILESSLFNFVFTDVVRMMTRHGGKTLGFAVIPEFYQCVPEFSETFMNQVHNMSWGMFTNVGDTYIISDEPLRLSLSSNLKLGNSDANFAKAMGGDQILDFPYTDTPDVDTIIDALAFKTVCDYFEGAGAVEPNTYRLVAVPPHPVYKVFVHYLYYDVAQSKVATGRAEMPYVLSSTGSPSYNSYATHWETFDIRPIVWTYWKDEYPKTQIGSLNYWTSVSQKQLARIYDFYFLGLFDAEVKGNTPIE